MKRTFLGHFSGLSSFLLFFCVAAQAGTEVGKVVSLTGKVMARIESRNARGAAVSKVRFLKPADPIFHEDVINTDSNGSVKILFKDQSIMDLGQSSLFKVEEFVHQGKPEDRKVEMSLSYGKIRAAINQKVGPLGRFKIRTRAATMGVRGTEFYVTSEIDSETGNGGGSASGQSVPQTKIVVTEGKVEVQPSKNPESTAVSVKPVELLPGEKFSAVLDLSVSGETGRTPASVASVEKVEPEEMKMIVQEGKLKDTTFSQAIQIDGPASSGASPPVLDSKGLPAVSFAGSETMAVIKDALLSKPEIRNPVPPIGGFGVPGGPMVQAGFNGNFLPGFITTPLVRLNVIIR
ncbi:MAG: FecR domain-containing protein [Bdellovibrionales bacterium]|nr:FecR domain-containing protein [Bdellovibrionales bacterium]